MSSVHWSVGENGDWMNTGGDIPRKSMSTNEAAQRSVNRALQQMRERAAQSRAARKLQAERDERLEAYKAEAAKKAREKLEEKRKARELERRQKVMVDRQELEKIVLDLYVANGKMPSPKRLKRERMIVYSDLLEMYGGSYGKMKAYFEKLYKEQFCKDTADEEPVAGKVQEQVTEEATDKAVEEATEEVSEVIKDMKGIIAELAEELEVVETVEPEEVRPEENVELENSEDEVTEQQSEDADEKEEVKMKPKSKQQKTTRFAARKLTKEDVIANLRKYYDRFGATPTKMKLDELRESEPEEGWLSYNSYYKFLGRVTGWKQYLEAEEQATDSAEAPAEQDVVEEDEMLLPEEADFAKDKEAESKPITEEMFEVEPEIVKADNTEAEANITIKLKLSLKAPGMKEPFEVNLDLFSSQK